MTIRVPAVQVPPRGIWGATGPAIWALTEEWTGAPLEAEPSIDDVVRRYLAAFGPASMPDVRTWSGLARQRDVIERLRPGLETFRDERGQELFDVPGAPRPDAEVDAPPRFLPEYDNVLLSHADRARIRAEGRLIPLPPGNGGVQGNVLVDGFFRGLWKVQRDGPTAVVRVEPFDRFTRAERAAVVAEGEQLAAFTAPDAERHGATIA